MIRITNLKIRFQVRDFLWKEYRLLQSSLYKRDIDFRCFGNFLVVKVKKEQQQRRPNCVRYTTLSCFYNGWINITGIDSCQSIARSLRIFRRVFFPHWEAIFPRISPLHIDNISATGHNKDIAHDFDSILKKQSYIIDRLAPDWGAVRITHNNQRFPGIFIKTNLATCIIYKTGKYVAVGIRKLDNLKNIERIIDHVGLYARAD